MCNPYKYRFNSRENNINVRVIKYLIVVIIASVIINFPRFFETQIVMVQTNGTVDKPETVEIVSYELSSLRRNPNYIRYT